MLTDQIKTEIESLAEEINKIGFGEVLIEIKHNQVALITYKGQKQPEKTTKNLKLPLTRPEQFANISV